MTVVSGIAATSLEINFVQQLPWLAVPSFDSPEPSR